MRHARILPLVVAVLAAAAVAAGPAAGPARADDAPSANPAAGQEPAKRDTAKEPKDGAVKEPGKDASKDATAVTRQERAKKLVQELETTITILKAAKTVDAETIRSLERALEDARKLAQPIQSAAELTEAERTALAEELGKKADGAKEPAPPNPFDDWRQRALASAFKDADLGEDEQIEASKIIQDWFAKSEAARMSRDSKAMSDLKGERDKALEKALGRRKAQKVINNLNGLSGGRR